MDSPRHLPFLATKSLSSLREEAESMDAVAALKKQRRYQRVDFDGRITTRNGESTTRESIHSRWSSNASTVREKFLEDRASRRASEHHANAASPAIASREVDAEWGSQTAKRSSRTSDLAPDSPPELPLLRISSFPDLLAAGLAMSSTAPDTTPVSVSDSFTVSDSSSFHGLLGFASEFPQPPSLSPALRKMQSVPWLKEDNAGGPDKSFGNYSTWRRSSVVVAPDRSQDVDISFPDSMDDLQSFSQSSVPSANSSFYLDTLMALNRQKAPGGDFPEETQANSGDVSWSGQPAYKTRTADDLLERSMSHRRERTQRLQPSQTDPTGISLANAGPHLMNRSDGRRNTVSSTPDVLVAVRSRTVRKVASMQSSSEHPSKPFSEATSTTKAATGQRSIQKIRSLRLFPSHSYSTSGSLKQQNPLVLGSRSQAELGKSRNWLFNHLRSSSGKVASAKQDSSAGINIPGAGAEPIPNVVAASMDGPERRNLDSTLLKGTLRRQRTPYPSQGGPPPTSAGERASKIYRRSRYRDSEPLISGLGLANYELESLAAAASKSSVGLGLDTEAGGQGYHLVAAAGTAGNMSSQLLGGPFTLKKSQANANLEFVRASRLSLERQDPSLETSTSFIDITPERKATPEKHSAAAVERKDRVRKFIAKAGSGFLEWSRGLKTAKRS